MKLTQKQYAYKMKIDTYHSTCRYKAAPYFIKIAFVPRKQPIKGTLLKKKPSKPSFMPNYPNIHTSPLKPQ
jgi:hypothetical protein